MLWTELATATAETLELRDKVVRVMNYAPWDEDQIARGTRVREAIGAAMVAIIENVPPSPTRTGALRKLIEARMDANAAITFRGQL